MQEPPQVARQLGGGRVTRRHGFGQALKADRLQVARQRAPESRDWIVADDLSQRFGFGLPAKGPHARQHFIQDHAQAIDIRLPAHGTLRRVDLLGGQVGEGAEHVPVRVWSDSLVSTLARPKSVIRGRNASGITDDLRLLVV